MVFRIIVGKTYCLVTCTHFQSWGLGGVFILSGQVPFLWAVTSMAENIRSNLFVDLWVHIRHRWVDLYFFKTKKQLGPMTKQGISGGDYFSICFDLKKRGGKENFSEKIKRQMFQLMKITLASSRRRCLIICVWMSTSFWWRVSCPSVINPPPQRTHTHTLPKKLDAIG